MDKIKLAYASSVSALLTIVYVTGVTIYADSVASFKTFLAGFTGHHWLTKSYSAFGLYLLGVILCYAFHRRPVSESRLNTSLWLLFGTAILGTVLVIAFYIWHFLVV